MRSSSACRAKGERELALAGLVNLLEKVNFL
jgi:hypothetical protein